MVDPNRHIHGSLKGYLAGTLEPADALELDRHCRHCADCRTIRDEAVHSGRATSGTRTFRRRFFSIYFCSAALAGVFLAAAHAHYQGLEPSRFDLKLVGQDQWLPDSVAALQVGVSDRKTGREMVGVPVSLSLRAPNSVRVQRLAELRTVADGVVLPGFQVPDWPDGRYELRVEAAVNGFTESAERPITLRRASRTMLSTDKPIYQPGQVIRVRSLSLRQPDLKPNAGTEVAFAVRDPKGNVVFRKRGVTSRFGIASTECALADELIEGTYAIECQVGEAAQETSVEVKRYALPKLKVDVVLEKPIVPPGNPFHGKVQARYIHGEPVREGTVEVQASLQGTEHGWKRSLKAKLDEIGTAAFEFVLPDSGDDRVSVAATVRDPAGQVQTGLSSCAVSESPIKIEVVPEGGTLARGQANRIYFLTRYHDGRPAKTRLNVSGFDDEIRTDDFGAAVWIHVPTEQQMQWVVQAQDDAGRVGRREVLVECETGNGFILRTNRAVYRAGETMEVGVFSPLDGPVYVDLVKDGQTVLTFSVPVSHGVGDSQVELPDGLFGAITLCATREGPGERTVSRSNLIYVRQARELNVRTTWDRAEYAPGGKARLNVALTDLGGAPAPGAVSLAVVDEAVYALLDHQADSEFSFFGTDPKLLKPIWELANWSPESVWKPGRNRFEQALFARAAHLAFPSKQGASRFDEDVFDESRLRRIRERPDWEELARGIGMPEVQIDALRDGGGTHTLSASSYSTKLQEVERERHAGLTWVGSAFVALFLVSVIAFGAWLVVYQQITLVEVFVILMIIGVLLALMMPAVQSARESARRSQAVNDLKQFGMAVAGAAEAGPASPRVRQWFPETLLWRPELVTDDQGRAQLDVDLADSITTWRVSASAVSARGELGRAQGSLRVFQPFFVDVNLPGALTLGDEVAVPVVVSNYLDRPQKVSLTLEDGAWFERLEGAAKSLDLKAKEVRATHYRLRARRVGQHELQVTARGGDAADAIKRSVEVAPGGRRIEELTSGSLDSQAVVSLSVPESAIEGSARVFVKIYPTSFSQVVEGLDAIFALPHGCFEQTSSTTYPNILALDYLKRAGKSAPDIEAKAQSYIHLGYQRLLSFEVGGGGFDWFGHPPANRALTAYGLMEFEDMARVHDIDPKLIERTRAWLLGQQKGDGSWDPEGHQPHSVPTGQGRGETLARLSTTAYIGWAVYGNPPNGPGARSTLSYLSAHPAESIDDPHVLALIANALLAIEPQGASARPYTERLNELKKVSGDGKFAWWQRPASGRSLFYGAGQSGRVETTALACLALLSSGRHPESARAGLAWLVAQKDSRGTWHSTQATVLALKALLSGMGKPVGGNSPRRIAMAIDGERPREVVIPSDQSDVVREFDLSDHVGRGTKHRLTLSDLGGSNACYQVVFRYHVPDKNAGAAEKSLSLGLTYSRSTVKVGELVTAVADVENRGAAPAPMLIVELPIPAGFALVTEDLDARVASNDVAKYQVTPRTAVVYLRGLEPRKPLALRYRLRAEMPVIVTAPPGRAYEYYDPSREAKSTPAQLTVQGNESPVPRG